MHAASAVQREVTLAVEDGWDSVHVLPSAGSRVLALCGRRPTIVWKRVWVELVTSVDKIPGCPRCIAAISRVP